MIAAGGNDRQHPQTKAAWRALVIAPEPLKPVNHGARVDIWNRYLGLSEQGWEMMLAFWHEPDMPREDLDPAFAAAISIPICRGTTAKFRRAWAMLSKPSLVALRQVNDVKFSEIVDRVRAFAPSIIVCETVYCYDLARRLADTLALPLIVRSHNIEHRYLATQFKLSTTLRQKLEIMAARLHLDRYETKALRSTQAVFDISNSDVAFWKAREVTSVHWVPSFFSAFEQTGDTVSWQDRKYDCGYLGNLWAPNNVAALTWFLDEVLPVLVTRKPDISVLVAGANPTPQLVERLSATPRVTLLANPASAAKTRTQIRVLINPIREGSGLNTKSVEMLFADSPLVVTPFAIVGMDTSDAAAYVVAETATAFAGQIFASLERPFRADDARYAARLRYGRRGAVAMSDRLKQEICRFQAVGGAR